ncbi:MAG: hypothetical protein FWF52_09680 [Candidatus Azobacteroides sp.]|nr:hypothetical protein [Candidatus Azobacteroides sp.]
MKNDYIYDALIAEMRKKNPKNSNLVNRLADILLLEKETIYRRLRNDVPFTFHEISTISRRMGISLDNIIGVDSQKNRPFQLKLTEYIDAEDIDFKMIEEILDLYRETKKETQAEMGCASNLIPQSLFSGFKHLTQFYLFKWQYHYNNERIKSFQEIPVDKKISELFYAYFRESKNIHQTYYVLDYRIFKNLTNDIRYFRSIRLLTNEDIQIIKEDLLRLLDYIENLAFKGQFKETGNKVNFYISEVNIDTNYTYLEMKNVHVSMLTTFILTHTLSYDEKAFIAVKNWLRSIVRISTLISVTSEKQRILYFEEQRQIIQKIDG